jgi:hypothetical protein
LISRRKRAGTLPTLMMHGQTQIKFIAAVVDLVKNDCRMASRIVAESFNIPKTVALRILKEDLGKRKLCASTMHKIMCIFTYTYSQNTKN